MDPMSLLVTRQGVADEVRRKSSYDDQPTRTTRITRSRLLKLFRRTVVTNRSTPAPRIVTDS